MANAYETTARKVIPAVLLYVEKDDHILMIHRNAKEGDFHQGKVNGLGGKLEPDESPRQAAARELQEECGIELPEDAFRSVGVLQFPNFKPQKNEDWVVWVFTAVARSHHESWPKGPEGELKWIHKDRLLDQNLWEGDRQFLPHVLADRPFVGTIWYEGGKVARHWIEALS